MNIDHEIDESLKRIQSHRGVDGVIVIKNNGDLITSTLDNRSSVSHAELIRTLADNAMSFVRNLDPSNELTVLRLGTKNREILVAPGTDFIMIVLRTQNHITFLRSITNS